MDSSAAARVPPAAKIDPSVKTLFTIKESIAMQDQR
jgi:hypothetical protein